METLSELLARLKTLDAEWSSGSVGSPEELVKLGKERKELKRKIQALEWFFSTVGYELTELGKAFEPVLLASGAFSMKYVPKVVFRDGRAREFVRSAPELA
jgi:hypothetical protein